MSIRNWTTSAERTSVSLTLTCVFHFLSNALFLQASGVAFHSDSRASNSVTRRFISRDVLSLCAYFLKQGMIDRWWQWNVKKKHSVGNFTSVLPDFASKSIICEKITENYEEYMHRFRFDFYSCISHISLSLTLISLTSSSLTDTKLTKHMLLHRLQWVN